MIKLNPSLLETDEFFESDFDSSLNGTKSKGTYNPLQFVIRLRDDIQNALLEDKISFDRIQAFSTFMHENIHWWQHVGSHLGFLTSLSYPALAHSAHQDLNTLVRRNETFKSIVEYDKQYFSKTGKQDNQEVNRILNNFHDINYAKSFILDNKNIHKILNDKRFFLHMGHCFHILWTASLNTLAASIDSEYTFLPKINEWHEKFQKLEQDKVPGFFIDSSMEISPLGTRAIFEGQARFNQLQYLSIASGNKLFYSDFEKLGMLHGIYIEAFDLFLKMTEIDRPDNFNNSIVGLYLLLCDIAINPTDGFPFDIIHYETFIISNDPGMRFVMLCHAIKAQKARWVDSVKEYSREEYINLSEELCKEIVCFPPWYGSAMVANWIGYNISIQNLLKEESEMRFKPENLSIRLFASKYIRFQEDKLKYPSIFCWTGKTMTSEASKELNLELVEKIFNRHRALFIDDIVGEIKPMIFENYSEQNTVDTFQSFYTFNTTYDMIMKWIRESGEFTYDYRWLTSKYSDEEMKNWIRTNFKDAFGIFPEELTVL